MVWALVLVSGRAEGAGQASASSAPAAVTPRAVRQFLAEYCLTCHNEQGQADAGALALDWLDPRSVGQAAEEWERVVRKLRAGHLLRLNVRRPALAMRDRFATWLEAELDDAAARRPSAGRPPSVRRLTRTEYGNAVRDLLELRVDVSRLLPPESDQDLVHYLRAARYIARTAVGSAAPPVTEMFQATPGLDQGGRLEGFPPGSRGGLAVDVVLPQDATYTVTVTVAGGGMEALELHVDGERTGTAGTEGDGGGSPAERPRSRDVRFVLPVRAGPHRLVATFAGPAGRVERVGIAGPLAPTGPGETPSRRRIFTCRPVRAAREEGCAKVILGRLVRQGFRRPVTAADLEPFLGLFREGRAASGFDGGIELAIRALLISPEFLHRVEADPGTAAPGESYAVPDVALASRLSFFLWSSIPDEPLLARAAAGRLHTPSVLVAEVRRMLADPRAEALARQFGLAYLRVPEALAQEPASARYPGVDEALREAVGREAELFFDSLRTGDRSVLDLLDAPYTFVNGRLAAHYGIAGVADPEFQRVDLAADSPRRGMLGKASILLATSASHRTSPARRGTWLLDTLLGAPPPPPPNHMPTLTALAPVDGAPLSMRDRMARHRRNPMCASCHGVIDPIGLALEPFDAAGRWREVDEALAPIDTAGTMPDGTPFETLAGLRAALLSRPDPFLRTFVGRLMAYATGRPLTAADAPAVRGVVAEARRDDFRFSSVVLAVVRSAPFLRRQVAVD